MIKDTISPKIRCLRQKSILNPKEKSKGKLNEDL